MRTSSAKAKGRRLQQHVRDGLRQKFALQECPFCKNKRCGGPRDPIHAEPLLTVEDIESRQMGGTGTDIVLSPAAKRLIKFDIECKNTEQASPWQWMKQAKENTSEGRKPCVVFTRNREDVYAMIRFEDLLELL